MFFALWPDARTRLALDRRAGALQRACGGRRVPAHNLHLTLVFVGALEAARLAALIEAARAVAPRKIDLVIDQRGYWRHNRIAWLGVSRPPARLIATSGELRETLAAAKVPFDAKAFVPHITLVRDAHPPREWPPFEPLRWRADGFALVSSEREREGPRYRVIARFRAGRAYGDAAARQKR